MKKIILRTFLIVTITFLAFMDTTMAQGKNKSKNKAKKERVGKKKNHGPPPWAPAHGYRAKTRYVYFKDHDVYYDNERGVYISISGKGWKIEAKLPDVLKNIDLKIAAKIELDFDGSNPHKSHKSHLVAYPKKKD